MSGEARHESRAKDAGVVTPLADPEKEQVPVSPDAANQRTAHAVANPEQSGVGSFTSTYHKFANIEFPIDAVIARLAAGESQKSIAAALGIAPPTLARRLHNIPEAAIAREIGMTHRLDDALELLESLAEKEGLDADDANLARVREAYLRRLEWRASVEHPHRFGAKPAVAIGVQGEGLTVNVVSYSNAAPLTVDNSSAEDLDSSK